MINTVEVIENEMYIPRRERCDLRTGDMVKLVQPLNDYYKRPNECDYIVMDVEHDPNLGTKVVIEMLFGDPVQDGFAEYFKIE